MAEQIQMEECYTTDNTAIDTGTLPESRRKFRRLSIEVDFDDDKAEEPLDIFKICVILVIGLIVSTLSGVAMIVVPADRHLLEAKIFAVVVLFQANLICLSYHLLNSQNAWSAQSSITSSVISSVFGTGGSLYVVVVALVRTGYTTYVSLFVGYSIQGIITLLFTQKNPCNKFKAKTSVLVALQIPPLQFLFSMFFGNFLSSLDIEVHLKLLVCFVYPLCIGVFKKTAEREN